VRVVGLHLVNCGTGPVQLNGDPKLTIRDENHHTVEGVRILQGTDQIGMPGTTPRRRANR
jgi:hypothetical protein